MTGSSSHSEKRACFASTAKGVEEVLRDEIAALGMDVLSLEKGGVSFSADLADIYRANLHLRTASRILLPLREFPCDGPDSLYEGVYAIFWEDFLTSGMTLAVDCNLRDSTLTHSRFVSLKAKDAIVDRIRERFGQRPNVDVRNPDLRVNVHIKSDRCTVSLDTSGDKLHQRGYRLDTLEAPLRETLAAALVLLTGWDGSVPLIDPMCGSGTIAVEGGMIAANRAPGLDRPFAFQRWPDFDSALWRRILEEAASNVRSDLPVTVYGRDVSPKAVSIAKRNAAKAGISTITTFRVENFVMSSPPSSQGILLFNPPYGQRLGDEQALKSLYRKIGDTLKQRYKNHTAYILAGNLDLAKHIGLKPSRKHVLFNGAIECRLLKYEIF